MSVPALMHVATPSVAIAESGLHSGYDGLVLDLQHGELGLETACTIMRSVPRGNPWLWARAASLETGAIGRLLDSGARGIVAPTIETAEQARALVSATKYPPLGGRSLGPSRPALYDGESYTEAGNAAVVTVVQIETVRGVENAEEILSVPGVDSVYIGPADLAVSYGLPGRPDWTDGPVHDAHVRIAEIARAHGVSVGIYARTPEFARGIAAAGLVDYVGLGIDLVMVGAQANAHLAAFRSTS
ncbi:HpcH/HpaI aldolase family protein [Nocardioides gilvus]|uniref:HpcH/HpaI aldolase family protein n=1 Tax=Nocardioides gilvus TaxID=1735589 RepID=UPI00194DE4BF|nr:aldolase/citrate lyase family protein [Nocardioides gilvus]